MTQKLFWTIDELGTQVALALAENYDGQSNGSIRAVPDRRTIRFYTTRGLLDRPAQMRGRTALYNRRHLLQLVAIKRLQAKGLSLGDIQTRLLGKTNTDLERIACIPPEQDSDPSPTSSKPQPEPRSESFWKELPTETIPAEEETESNKPPPVIQGIALSDAVTLLVETARNLEEDDIEAIRIGAASLLKLLHRRRLVQPRQKGDSHDHTDNDSD